MPFSSRLFFLWRGFTSAIFRLSGNIDVFIDVFIIDVRGSITTGLANLTNFADIPSWPVAFLIYCLFICFSIKILLTGVKLNSMLSTLLFLIHYGLIKRQVEREMS